MQHAQGIHNQAVPRKRIALPPAHSHPEVSYFYLIVALLCPLWQRAQHALARKRLSASRRFSCVAARSARGQLVCLHAFAACRGCVACGLCRHVSLGRPLVLTRRCALRCATSAATPTTQATPEEVARNREVIKKLLQLPENKTCADCGKKGGWPGAGRRALPAVHVCSLALRRPALGFGDAGVLHLH